MKMTRNISGNANVNDAAAGFRQNVLCSHRICRPMVPNLDMVRVLVIEAVISWPSLQC